jgi:hypothetical protein
MVEMRRLGILLLLVVLPVRAGDDRPERRVADPKLQSAINKAVDRGVEYLRSRQQQKGQWLYGGQNEVMSGGMTALSLYALAASGVRRDDPAIRRGLDWVERHPLPYGPGSSHGTYCASLLVLALTRINARIHRHRIHELADRLAASQLESDMWTYGLRRGRATSEKKKSNRRKRREYVPGDNSNSQFAILALWSAQTLAGWEAPRGTWLRVLEFYARTQNADGSWSYTSQRNMGGSLSMTAAGLVSCVYAEAALHGGYEGLPLARGSVWAQKGLTAFRKFARSSFYSNYYAVYSAERVGTVLDLPVHEWYEPGARELVRAQNQDGSWQGQPYQTALALLFLSRATRASITPRESSTDGGGEKFPDLTKPAELARAFDFYVAFNPRSRAKVRREFGKAGPAAVALFVEKLSDHRELVRSTAFELLTALVDRAFFFDPAAALHQREIMLRPIRAWWGRDGTRLRWDDKAGKFVR